MTRTARAAMIAAVLTSAISIADGVYHGLTGQFLLNEDINPRVVTVSFDALLAVTFALLAVVLMQQADRVDAGGRVVRWIRRLMQGVLALPALAFAAGLAVDRTAETSTIHRIWDVAGGISFVLMFMVGIVLGVCLLRRPDLRVAAVLMAAPAALIPLLFLVQALAPGWAHPAYAETALYIGLALLGFRTRYHAHLDAKTNETTTVDTAIG
jgi:hypothetical protein